MDIEEKLAFLEKRWEVATRDGLIRNLRVTTELEEKLRRENARLREEVKSLRREYELEREARLSTEKEKKGLSLLDMLTRSGLTKSLNPDSNPELVDFLRRSLEDAISQSLGRASGESGDPPRISAVS
jgi:uncharacterized protein YxjI